MRRRILGSLPLAVVFVAIVVCQQSQAQQYRVLHRFTGGADGVYPHAGLSVDASGNLYGTTEYGGLGSTRRNGTVYKLDSASNYSVVHSFTPNEGYDLPGGLRIDRAGNLYGVTSVGALGFGTVFKIDPNGKERTLYAFQGGADGALPLGDLVADSDGNLYGATSGGGTDCYCGVIYKLDRFNRETVLYAFKADNDGMVPVGVIRDPGGNLYGVTRFGGLGTGTIFKIDPAGVETILHTFTGGSDGASPYGGLVRDAAGNLYGTASQGGDPTYGAGVVFRLDSAGGFTVLHTFAFEDGKGPEGTLVLDSAGDLYGTTSGGGARGRGTVYRLDPSGKHTVLYSFTETAGGYGPGQVRLLLYKGSIYGTTTSGGDRYGVVFKLTP